QLWLIADEHRAIDRGIGEDNSIGIPSAVVGLMTGVGGDVDGERAIRGFFVPIAFGIVRTKTVGVQIVVLWRPHDQRIGHGALIVALFCLELLGEFLSEAVPLHGLR